MDDLTERQKILLTMIIHEFVRTALPVGSLTLVDRYHLEMSSATVRNEMAVLTELGYLRQPHTSAGRVPSEEGYRYFVSNLLQESDLPEPMRHTISHQFYQMRHDVEQWMRLAASVLAKQSKGASLVTAPHNEAPQLKHLELISTRGHQILAILVLFGGEVRQRYLNLPEQATQDYLSETSRMITAELQLFGEHLSEEFLAHLDGLQQEILAWVLQELEQAKVSVTGEVFLDGLTNILSEPEFIGNLENRRAIHLLEERSLLQDLLSRTILSETVGSVQVLIGGEGTFEDLRQCSIVLARYGTPGLATGTLGVLGPMRMPYGRTISTVRFISNLLSSMVTETLTD